MTPFAALLDEALPSSPGSGDQARSASASAGRAPIPLGPPAAFVEVAQAPPRLARSQKGARDDSRSRRNDLGGGGRRAPFLSRESVGRRRAGRHRIASLSATASALRLARIRTVRAGGVTGPDTMTVALLSATGSGLRSEPPRVCVRAGRFLASSLTGGRANAVAFFSRNNSTADA